MSRVAAERSARRPSGSARALQWARSLELASQPARAFLLVAALLVLAMAPGCGRSARPGGPGGFGISAALAVEVCYPPGVVAYLKRLRCPDGSHAREVERVSVGSRTPTTKSDPRLLEQLDPGHPLKIGEPDFHIVDRFTLSCPGGDRQVFIDMYHCLKAPPEQAPEGLGLE